MWLPGSYVPSNRPVSGYTNLVELALSLWQRSGTEALEMLKPDEI